MNPANNTGDSFFLHESSYVGTAAELAQGVASGDIPTRGEFVLVVAGAAPDGAVFRCDYPGVAV